MEHKFPVGSFHRENETTFSGILFIPENFQWNEPKSCVPFTPQPEFLEFFGEWQMLTKTIRPFALKGHGSIAYSALPHGLLTRNPCRLRV